MKKLIKLTVLMLVIAGISACGKMGELEAIKPVPVSAVQTMTAPELNILPHKSK